MPDQLRYAQSAAGITRRGLNPQLLERSLAENTTIAHAVQRDATGETQLIESRLAMRGAHHAQHDLLAHVLNRARQIHLALGELRLRRASRSVEELREGLIGHRETREVPEVLLIQFEGAVGLEVDEMIVDPLHV